MKLEIDDALHLLLALPAHRSQNEGHRLLGKTALDQLVDYEKCTNDEKGKAFNKAMIALVLSATRAFSVERDQIDAVWKSIESIHLRRERLTALFRRLSPLTEGNYWTKSIALISSVGISLGRGWPDPQAISISFVICFVGFLLILELISQLIEYFVASRWDRKTPLEKATKWKEQSVPRYQKIVEQFISEAIEIYKHHFPRQECLGVNLGDSENVSHLKKRLLNNCFYLN